MKLNSPRIVLGILIFTYLIFLNYSLVSDLGFDEARHSVQGLFFTHYLQTLMSGEWQSPGSFLETYSTKNYAIAWYALYDPPVHALSQALVFTILGADPWTARFTTMLWVILGSSLLFLLARSVLLDEWWALFATVMFLLWPFTYYFSRQAMLAIPIALMTCGWLYFLLYSQHRYRLLFAALCLSAAGLMQYQSMIFFAAFAIIYCAILFWQQLHQHHWHAAITKTLVTDTVRSLLFSSMVFVVLFAPWYFLSFESTNISEKLLEAGTVEVKGGVVGSLNHYLSFFTQIIQETWGLGLLALLGTYALLRHEAMRKHWPLALYVLSTLLVASILMSNKQLRYISHVMGPLAILVTLGIKDRLFTITSGKRRWVLGIFIILVLSSLVVADLREVHSTAEEWGQRQDDVYEWLYAQPLPRIVIGLQFSANESTHQTNYYSSPDLFVFRSMMVSDTYDPAQQGQAILRLELLRPGDLEKTIEFLALSNESASHFFILDTLSALSMEGRSIGDTLSMEGFSSQLFEEHIVFFRSRSASQITSPVFPSIAQQASATLHLRKGLVAFDRGDLKESRDEFALAMKRDPLLFEARINLAKVLRRQAIEAQMQGNTQAAASLLRDALIADPTYALAREQLSLLSRTSNETLR